MRNCFLGLTFAAITALMLTAVLPITARGQSGCQLATLTVPRTEEIFQAIKIVEPITERSGSAHAVGQFYEQGVSVNIPIGSRVLLSSSSDGRLGLCTDDFAALHVSGTGKGWQHDFRSNGGIAAILPVDITHLFAPGDNGVTLTLTDLVDPAYSSSAYYIVVLAPAATATPLPTATSTDTPMPTATKTATATDIPTNTATQTPTETASATATASNTPTPKPTATATNTPLPTATKTATTQQQVAATSTLVAPNSTGRKLPLLPRNTWSIVAVVATALLAAMWWVQSRKLRLAGEITLYRNGQFVGSYPLEGRQTTVIDGTGQLLDAQAVTDNVAIRLSMRNKQTIAEQIVAGNVQETYVLQHGDDIHTGELLLHYENYGTQNDELNDEEAIYAISNN